MSVPYNIKRYRKEKKMTQRELAEKANISRSYLGDIEGGRYNPSLDTLNTIAKALNVNINSLLTDSETNTLELSPTLSKKEERDIAKDLDAILADLDSKNSLSFYDEQLDDATREALKIQLEASMRLAKQLAKQKFTPKKYRNEE
ncbi:helix-turn-helix transcriptional regulator [Bacillus wiedmannii]|uniref:helix-turn-helix domain-containing protein n=1 Tax=Bacillus wiedmannii TaxID=1890302 RepID=UPI0010BD33DE|nr:helix-turn-helix transcriptional regulator [Bacillus wiedmannii]TKH22865.1 helix-turn-helix transcriptional regulator [Bacillus wiedmannii]